MNVSQNLIETAGIYSLELDASAVRPNLHFVDASSLDILDSLAASFVGRTQVDDAVTRVRRGMLREALARSAGNLTKAASLLGVQRQAVQHMVIRYELRAWASQLRKSALRDSR